MELLKRYGAIGGGGGGSQPQGASLPVSTREAFESVRPVASSADVTRTGIPWRYLPHDYPHWNTVYQYFARWEQAGVFEQLNALLRRRVREDEGRTPEPTAMVIDAQSIIRLKRFL